MFLFNQLFSYDEIEVFREILVNQDWNIFCVYIFVVTK